MTRTPLPCRLAIAIAIALPGPAGAADAARALRIDAAPLPRCLEQIAAATGARFIVSPALAEAAPRCRAVDGATDAAMALDAALSERDIAWRLREDGVYLLASTAPVAAGSLDALTIEDTALEGTDAARAAPPSFRPAFAELAAETRYSRAELAAKPVQRFNQLGRLAPNVYSSGESLSIRGVPRDNDYFTGNGVFLDGIDVGSLLLDHNLLAIDDLEALRYERSGTGFALGGGLAGGAIRVDTPLPTPAFGLRAILGAGERSATLAALAVNGPLLPDGSLSGRIALSAREEPRFMRSAVVPGIDGDTDRRDHAQVRLRFEPDALPGLTLDLTGFHVDGDAPDRSVARPGNDPSFDLYRRVSFDRSAIDYDLRATGRGLRAAYEWADGSRMAAWGSDLRASREGVALVEPNRTTLRGDDEDRSRGGVGAVLPFGEGWRLFGALERQRVERSGRELQRLGDAPVAGAGATVLNQDILALDNTALLAELSYESGPWRASAGVRAVDETVEFRFRQRIEPASAAVIDRITQRTATSYRRNLPAAALEYAIAPTQSLGGSWSRAYRSGGFSEFVVVGEYPPETLDTAELWWRARSTDARFGFRAALFRTDWTNRTSIDGTIGAEIIAPFETRIDGAEFEFDWRATDALALRGGLGWLDARHTSGRYRLNFSEFDLDGRRATDAPGHTIVLGAIWRGEGGWTAALDAYRAGRAESSTFVVEAVRERVALPRDAYTVVDARVGWQGDRLGVALTATNLFDAEYIDRFVARRAFSRILGEPRQVDLMVTWTW
jgi:hypothetical protein